jgi:hypothetical protein
MGRFTADAQSATSQNGRSTSDTQEAGAEAGG